MNLRLLIIVSLLWLTIPLPSLGSAATLDDCNDLYYQTLYAQAIECYQELGGDVPSAPLLYNIGNAHAQLGQTSRAILHYLRAHYLAPGDADSTGNLELLRKEQGLFPPEPSPAQLVADRLTISQWSLLGLSALLGYLGYSLYRLKKRHGWATELTVLLVCALLFAAGAFGAGARYQYWRQAVVMVDGQLLVSPFHGAASTGTISQGRLVRPHSVHREFIYVTDETGRTGWLAPDSIEPIIPH